MHDVTIVLPTLEEERTVGELVSRLVALYPGVRVLVADDDSRDATRERARAAAPDAVEVLHRRGRSRGLTASVIDAALLARTPFLVVMDADLQHDPAVIASLMGALREGAAIAVAKRATYPGLSPLRRAASRGATFLTRSYLRARNPDGLVADPLSGFFAIRADIAQDVLSRHAVEFEHPGFKVLLDFLKFLPPGARVAEVPYDFAARSEGLSKATFRTFVHLVHQLGAPGRAIAYMMTRAGWLRIARWATVGALGILLNEALLFLLHSQLAWPLAVAGAFATETAVAWNFTLHEMWTWRDHHGGARFHRMMRFQLVSLGALAVTEALLLGLTSFAGWHYLSANLAGIILGSALNFAANDRWTWR
ncbi:MAG: GtrA family protein [Thermoplasmatota archaeon]